MIYNTGNAVPSNDPRDLDDNAQAFDRLMNSGADTELDRLGVPRLTWTYVENAATALVSPNVMALSGLVGAPDRIPYFTGAGALSLAVFTSVARTLMAATTQAAQRAALGLTIGGANGVATLGADGLLPPALLPPLAVNETFVVASQAAQQALTAQRGDVAIRSDLSGAAYILTTDDPTVFANWVPIQQNLGASLQALGALTPAANQLGYFTGTGAAGLTSLTSLGRSLIGTSSQATVRTAILAAASGANSDITSLSALTTALSIAQGGTGGNTAASARVALGAAASGANADITGLSALVGTAFAAIPLTNSWAATSGSRAVYRKYLGMLQLEVNITGGTITDGTIVGTLPAGFRPPFTITIPVASAPNVAPAAGTFLCRAAILADGTIRIYNCGSSVLFAVTLGLE